MWSGLLWKLWQRKIQLVKVLFKEVLKLSEKRFRANYDVSIYDSETEEYISTKNGLEKIAKRMNELNDENEQLRQTIKEMQQDEQLYANEILEWKIRCENQSE